MTLLPSTAGGFGLPRARAVQITAAPHARYTAVRVRYAYTWWRYVILARVVVTEEDDYKRY